MKAVRKLFKVNDQDKIEGTTDNHLDIYLGIEASKQAHQTNDQTVVLRLIQCIDDTLSDHCVEFRSDSQCNSVKRFLSKCPDAKPRQMRINART